MTTQHANTQEIVTKTQLGLMQPTDPCQKTNLLDINPFARDFFSNMMKIVQGEK